MSAPKTDDDLRVLGFVQGPDGWTKPTRRETMIARDVSDGPIVKTLPFSKPAKRVRQSQKPLLNKTESRYLAILETQGHLVWKQAITLALDPPFKSYRADLAYLAIGKLFLVEVKAPHRFARAGIAKAACAAKTYPQFIFVLAFWKNGKFEESQLSG